MRRSLVTPWVVACLAVTTLVLAQGRKAPVRGKPKSKPTASATRAPDGSEDKQKPLYEDDPSSGAPDAGVSSGSSNAETVAESTGGASKVTFGDGGVRSSPLNPRAEEFPDGGAPANPVDLDKIMGDIAALRARVAVIGDTLWKSRILLRVETRGDHAKIGKLAIGLDDGLVYTAPAGFSAEDETTVYDHAVAPGRHVLSVDIERRDDRGDTFRTGQQSRVTVEVPENQRLEATIRIDDDSDMGSDFPSSQKGSYDLRVRVRAKARK